MNRQPLKILFVTSEVFPLIKTGGLADVSSGLPLALHALGHDVRIIVPGYKTALEKAGKTRVKLKSLNGTSIRLLEGSLPESKLPVWFVDCPELFFRNGGPYGAANGIDWPDNAERFNTFSKVSYQVATNKVKLNWQPDIVHCNDWQSGLVPAYLWKETTRPATIFTIHNLAYLGLFPKQTFEQLSLDEAWWDHEKLEFHNQLSYLKGGLVYADRINTVSPTYAQQILTPEFGYGMEGLLAYRQDCLSGILNGIDNHLWNPEKDPLITKNFTFETIDDKQINKEAIQKHFNLPVDKGKALIGIIGRMVEQKGFDLILNILTALMHHNVQIVMLGSGDKELEAELLKSMNLFPDRISIELGYNESLAHLIEAGSDMFLMPSRFEPCGLNQFYSLRYGTVPIVSHTGGLADSVVDSTAETLENQTATGFKFYQSTPEALHGTLTRAIASYNSPSEWRKIIKNGMQQNFSWTKSAQRYLSLYQEAIKSQGSQATNKSV